MSTKWYFRRIHSLRPEIYHIRFIQSFSTNDLKLAMQWIDPKVYYLIMQTPCEPSENYPHQISTTSYIKGIYIYCHCALKKRGLKKTQTAFGFSRTFPDGSSSSWSKVDSPSTNKASKLVPGPCSVSWNHTMEPSWFPKTHKIGGKIGRFGFWRWEISLHLYLERVFFFIQWVQRKMQQKLPWTCLASASGCWVIRMFYIFALGFSRLQLMKIESKT